MARIFSSHFKNYLIDCFSRSVDTRMCNKIGERIDPHFNIHQISGISEKMNIQPILMATNFVDYFFKINQELKMVHEIIRAELFGVDGYPINIFNFNGLLNELSKLGYRYDKKADKLFFVDKESSLLNWGFLEDGQEYTFCFVSVDIVQNSRIVRENNPRLIKETYKTFHDYIRAKITARDGRIWNWEGDGGILAFQGNTAVKQAVYGVLDFYLSLPVFNAAFNKLKNIIIPRIAIHPGTTVFKNNINDIQSEPLQQVKEIEKKHTPPGYIVISNMGLLELDSQLKSYFYPMETDYKQELYHFVYTAGRRPYNE